jgi:hypothetical protein
VRRTDNFATLKCWLSWNLGTSRPVQAWRDNVLPYCLEQDSIARSSTHNSLNDPWVQLNCIVGHKHASSRKYIIYFFFLVWPLLANYCKYSKLFLHFNTLSGAHTHIHTHTHTHTHTVDTTPRARERTVAQVATCTTHNIRKRQSCPRRDSNPKFQQASSCRPTTWTARPPESATNKIPGAQNFCSVGKQALCVLPGNLRLSRRQNNHSVLLTSTSTIMTSNNTFYVLGQHCQKNIR